MLAAFDIDGTIDAEPATMMGLMCALKAAGHIVAVLTGSGNDQVEVSDIEGKTEYLRSLGFDSCYDTLAVVTNPVAESKAAWLKANRADLLVDNDKDNAKAAAGICPVLVPWTTRK